MVEGNLDTTNLLLGILAAASVLQVLMLIGAAVMGYRMYARAMAAVRDLEQRQVAPLVASVHSLMAKVDAILVDVKDMTGRVTRRTERVDSAIQNTLDRVDETAGRVRSSVASRVHQVLGVIHGAKCAIDSVFNNRAATHS